MPVRFTSVDYFEGRDPALETIVRLLGDVDSPRTSSNAPREATDGQDVR